MVRPKKSLGQNFLVDKNIIKKILSLVNINENNIIEIGPGTGNLTNEILKKNPSNFLLIEKDRNLYKQLKERNKNNNVFSIFNEDILNFDLEKRIKKNSIVFGNLPYNISTQILAKWIKLKNLNKICKKMILMFQKEVANRIIAKSNTKDYGRISILSSWKYKITKIKDIKPSSFYPKPKIESTILLFEPKDEYFEINKVSNLEYITNIFFNQRRKMIKKPIKLIFKNSLEICKKLNLNENNRPQNLSPNTYYEICREYEKLIN